MRPDIGFSLLPFLPSKVSTNLGAYQKPGAYQLRTIQGYFIAFFTPRYVLAAENAALRHQLIVLQRRSPQQPALNRADRLFFALLYRFAPNILKAIRIVRPETVVRWRRMGFRALWCWKSRPRGGRSTAPKEIRDLICQMSLANSLWGAPRIHGELLMLGINVSQSTVAKYMVKRRSPPSQSWKAFLQNHTDGVASVDFLIVPTIGFKLLYAFVVLSHGRRKLLHIAITDHPTAEWTARQTVEAFPWGDDNDAIFGAAFKRQLASMGIRDGPTALRSPWQNGYVERVIGSIRRECLDHMIILNAGHLRRVLRAYAEYYNSARTHLSLEKNAPVSRHISTHGSIQMAPHLGGLHHKYSRI